MKELREILDAYEAAKQRGEKLAIATIVKTKGSTYRRPGARLMMTAAGEMTGSISGGCLEGDIFQHAEKVLQSNASKILHYDTTSDNDLIWGLGLGCSGVVYLLLEPLQEEPSYWAFLTDCVRDEKQGVLATVFGLEGKVDAVIGSRLTMNRDGVVTGDVRDSELAKAITEDCRLALKSGRSRTLTYKLQQGSAEVLIEALEPPLPFYVFGAGHDSIPVVRMAKELGWRVTVVDGRKAYATQHRFPQADQVILSPPDQVCKNVSIDPRAAVIVMTHNYAHDRDILRQLIEIPVRYLGMLGPAKRTDALMEELGKEGLRISRDRRHHMYSPSGLDLGSETPEEIALSILSEIQSVIAGRSGGPLRTRKGPIHERDI